MTWTIYALRIGTSTEYRYVGLSRQSLPTRLYQHKKVSNRYQTPVYKWIRNHLDEVVIDVIEECPEGDFEYLADAEQYWIGQIRSFGHRLLNLSDGGASGSFGARWTLRPEQIRTGKDHPMYGRTYTPEEAKRLGAHNIGNVRSEESRRKQGETLKAGAHWSKGPNAEIIREKGRKNAHVQHHTNKSVSKPETCKYCAEALT